MMSYGPSATSVVILNEYTHTNGGSPIVTGRNILVQSSTQDTGALIMNTTGPSHFISAKHTKGYSLTVHPYYVH